MLPDIQPGNTKILYFFNCLLDGMHTIGSLLGRLLYCNAHLTESIFQTRSSSLISEGDPQMLRLKYNLVIRRNIF